MASNGVSLPCKMLTPIMEQVKTKFSDVSFQDVNIDEQFEVVTEVLCTFCSNCNHRKRWERSSKILILIEMFLIQMPSTN